MYAAPLQLCPSFSSLAFSSPALLSVIFQSCIFLSCNFSRPFYCSGSRQLHILVCSLLLSLCSGLMFASVAWIELAGSLIGDVIQNAVFAATVSWMKNFVFFINAGGYFLATLLTVYAILCADNCMHLNLNTFTVQLSYTL